MIRNDRIVRPVHREGELIMVSDASFLSLVLSKALYQVKALNSAKAIMPYRVG